MLIYFVCINLLGVSGREISRSKIRAVRQGSIREILEEFPISQNWGKCPQDLWLILPRRARTKS